MGYHQEDGLWADTKDVTLESALAVSGSSGTGTVTEFGDKTLARLTLLISAIGAGTTLTATVMTCDTEDGTFRALTPTFTSASATGSELLSFPGLDRFVRVDWALSGGTTTATYTVSGEAV